MHGLVKLEHSVASLGVAGRLVHLHGGTRRTGQLGDTFLTGVDRRVQAPLGTVINFSGLVTVTRRPSRVNRCIGVVRAGGRLLLRLIGSVLSLSGVRTKRVSFGCSTISLSRVFGGLRRICGSHIGSNISLIYRLPSITYIVRSRGGQLARILSGFLDGTYGCASRNSVAVKCREVNTVLHFCITSANGKLTRRGVPRIFRHFTGFSDFIRKAKLKLSVYRSVVRSLSNGVNISSRLNGNSAF